MVRQGSGDHLGTAGAKKRQVSVFSARFKIIPAGLLIVGFLQSSECSSLVWWRWGQAGFREEVGAEGVAGADDGLQVGVEVALGGVQGAVPGDQPQDVQGDSGIGHPRKSGVAQIVASQVLVAEVAYDVVPVCGVAQDGGGDAPAAWPGLADRAMDAPRSAAADPGDAGGCRQILIGDFIDEDRDDDYLARRLVTDGRPLISADLRRVIAERSHGLPLPATSSPA
jgi:hypothetical protein